MEHPDVEVQPIGVPILKYKKTSLACMPCRSAKVGCDTLRPCTRCTKQGIINACVDLPHVKRASKKTAVEGESDAAQTGKGLQKSTPPVKPTEEFEVTHRLIMQQHQQLLQQYQQILQQQLLQQQQQYVSPTSDPSLQYPFPSPQLTHNPSAQPTQIPYPPQNTQDPHNSPHTTLNGSSTHTPYPPQNSSSPLHDHSQFSQPPHVPTQNVPQDSPLPAHDLAQNPQSTHTPSISESSDGAFPIKDLASANEKIELLAAQINRMNIDIQKFMNIVQSTPPPPPTNAPAYPNNNLPSYLDMDHPWNTNPTALAIWQVEDKQFVDCNEPFAKMLGYDSVEQFLGSYGILTFFDIVSPLIRLKVAVTCRDAYSKNIQCLERPGLLIRKDGSEMKVFMKITYHGNQFVTETSVPNYHFQKFSDLTRETEPEKEPEPQPEPEPEPELAF